MLKDRWARSVSTLLLVIVTFAAFSRPADVLARLPWLLAEGAAIAAGGVGQLTDRGGFE